MASRRGGPKKAAQGVEIELDRCKMELYMALALPKKDQERALERMYALEDGRK